MRVLVTRPREDSARTASLLAAHGHRALLTPIFDVVPIKAELPSDVDAVIAASANGIRMADAAALRRLGALPLFAVGAATAAAARAAGFTQVRAGAGDSRDLARLLVDDLPRGARILHLAGRPRRDESIAALAGRFALHPVETYETIAARSLPAEIAHALRSGLADAILHFSPRAAQVFGDLTQDAGLLEPAQALLHVFISEQAVDPRFTNRRVADRPSLESVVAAL
jgi:uroporphyrinogen-III synthase